MFAEAFAVANGKKPVASATQQLAQSGFDDGPRRNPINLSDMNAARQSLQGLMDKFGAATQKVLNLKIGNIEKKHGAQMAKMEANFQVQRAALDAALAGAGWQKK